MKAWQAVIVAASAAAALVVGLGGHARALKPLTLQAALQGPAAGEAR
ncbi:MAG: hypothetical protein ABI655_05420 [Phenylobacterium sp.]